ncbi:PIN domain-containing protein [Luteolibacter yonseiensis]|uniref:PIN domain-containing protein n=1 Tax=Luteolibacter yonseiensis TaxID=1144680 RepID=A0A934R201_9BACT|nr:PIN domain-containing protein [Luteolibacter yonseiensis]MBK1814982.1 PIN domain-containing protein [Luteolibacter yonseiensis]
MKILIDTDVLLDVALAREPHLAASAGVLEWAEAGGEACVAWHTLTNCSYLLKGGRPFLVELLKLVEVSSTGTADAARALALPMTDVEDAFQVAAALAWHADFIVTRNLPDYRHSPVTAISPADFLEKL